VEAFLVSTMVVGLAEIGDKTQILSLMLAARFRRPLPIIFGILLATLADHAAAGLAGSYFGDLLNGPWLRWIECCCLIPCARSRSCYSRVGDLIDGLRDAAGAAPNPCYVPPAAASIKAALALVKSPTSSMGFVPKVSSHRTPRWREMDSNSRSPVGGDTPQRPQITSLPIIFP
jgi:hypothetical protein